MDNPTVSFSGEGMVRVEPDEATLVLVVKANSRENLNTAMKLQAEKARGLTKALGDLSVPKSGVSTVGYNSGPMMRYDRKTGENIPTGEFEASQTFSVRVPKDKASDVVGVTATLALVDQFNFTVSEKLLRESREKATELAITDAEKKAKRREERVGFTLGEVVGFAESAGGGQNVRGGMRNVAYAEAALGGAAPELPAGETEIRSAVTLTYWLKL